MLRGSWSGVGHASVAAWEAKNAIHKCSQWLVGCWGPRVRSQYMPKTSPRRGQNGGSGSTSSQGGPRGNRDNRRTPFGSHGVPLGSPLGPPKQFSCRFTMFCCFSGRGQHSTESAPSPLRYRGRGTIKPFCCIVVLLLCKTQTKQDQLSTKALKLQGSGGKCHLTAV